MVLILRKHISKVLSNIFKYKKSEKDLGWCICFNSIISLQFNVDCCGYLLLEPNIFNNKKILKVYQILY